MKMTFVTTFLLLTALFTYTSCRGDNYVPAKNITDAFKTKYPSAKRVEWEMKSTYHVAEFRVGNIETEAWFDKNGTWVMTESDIPFNSLPVVIRNNFSAGEHGKWRVEDVDKLERVGMEAVYIIEVEQGEQEIDLHYLENGTLVKTVMDKNNKGYLPEMTPQTALTFIQQKYPQAKIVEVDQENGRVKIDIMDNRIMKEVVFDHNNQWIVTSWDVRQANVPTNVMNALQSSEYGKYRIDDIEYEERADGTNVYLFEVEQGQKEILVTINATSLQILSAIHKD